MYDDDDHYTKIIIGFYVCVLYKNFATISIHFHIECNTAVNTAAQLYCHCCCAYIRIT